MGANLEPAVEQTRGLWLSYVEVALALVAGGLWYTQGGAVWYAGSWPGPWPLALLGLAGALHLARVGFRARLSALDVPLWLFLLSAGVGVWAAYNRGPAWAMFWLLVGAAGLYYAIAGQPDAAHLEGVLAFWGLFGAAFALYFLATNDWGGYVVKVPLLTEAGQRLQRLLPALAGHRVTPNVAGGMLAMLLPYYVPLWVSAGRRGKLWRVVCLLSGGMAALGWVLSVSRGAWGALLGMAALWGVWRAAGRWSARRGGERRQVWRARLMVMAGVLAGGAALAALGMGLILGLRLPGAGSLAGRLSLYRDGLLLARDYRLIGAGLGVFPMHFAIYTLLIHVGYVVYIHNMLLSILISQGLAGLLPFLWLLGAGVALGVRTLGRLEEGAPGADWVIEAALASLGVMLAHGMVDEVAYGSRAALLLLVPLGVIAAAARWTRPSRRRRMHHGRSWQPTLAAALVVVTGTLGLGGWRAVAGMWYANLGALAQARVELNVYDQAHFDNPTMDQVRARENLDEAIGWFRRAVAADPRNPTARQRLAEIALARGQYTEALVEAQAAVDAGYRDSVTRLLYGDALVANGQVERAVQVVQGLEWAEARLLGQAWSRYWLGKDYQRAADAWRAALLLNPQSGAAGYLKEAESKLEAKP